MIKTVILAACTATGFVSSLAPAQQTTQQPPQQDQMLQSFDQLRVPLHSAPADPEGGEYGLWAAGPGFKASFHDGFSFYPYRGPDKALVRMHWRTESVTLGGTELVTVTPSTNTTDWRHELRYGPVTEVYDVLTEGVEQSFVLHRPVATGDLVVTGRIGGGLSAASVDAAPQALEFTDGQDAVVRYGEAVAFDAAGARVPVQTTFDGTRIRLTLGREFLDRATFPVVVDPLTSSVSLSSLLSGRVSRSAMAVDNGTTTGKAMVVYTRQFAAGDADAYGLLCNRDFSSPVTVWSEITTSWSTENVDVAHVDGANRFAVAVQRDLSASSRGVRVYLHGDTHMTLNSGPTLPLHGPAGTRRQNPQISGARGIGGKALVVFEEEHNGSAAPSASTRVMAVRIDVITGALTLARDLLLGPSGGVDSEMPAVVASTSDNNSWVAVWRNHRSSPSSYSINIARIDRFGVPNRNDLLLNTTEPVSHLAVAGSWTAYFRGRYAAAWVQASANRRTLKVRRFNQGSTGSPTFHPARTVASSSLEFYGDVDLAHDWLTLSHWALAYTRTTPLVGTRASIVRLGYTGGTTESQSLAGTSSGPSGLAVAYAEGIGKGSFPITYGVNGAIFLPSFRGTELRYPLDALSTTYGPICQAGVSITSNLPFAGHEFFRVQASPVALNEFVYFIIGFAPTSVPLLPYGFPPTCHLSVDPTGALTSAFLNTNPSGRAVLQIALPDAPVLIGDVFIQAVVFPGGGTTPFVTHGLGVQVR